MEDPTKIGSSSGDENKTAIKGNTTGDTKSGDFVAGTVLAGRYRIIGIVGKGGMGEVYKAEDIKLSQIVALKFLPDSYQNDSDALERFHGEVRNARQVSHVNVCRVFDIGEIDGRHFLSMEFVDGDDLSELLTRVGRFTSERAVEISRQLCVGMEAIHKAGILHRDFKPANIIIDKKGIARITDFGIAGIEAEIAKDSIRAGTPAYMAPEQISGKEVSTRSDIYALGLVIYEIFTGKQAFIADTFHEMLKKQQTETPTNPSQIVKGIDPLVESVIAQCLEKDPKDRPHSALQVAMALPGGNPLQIALDAGQTPSPEMVAASPKKGALKPKVALACFAFFVFALIGIIYVNGFYKAYNFIPLEKSREALTENIKRMVKSFGYADRPADSKSSFDVSTSFVDYAAKNEAMSNTVERLRTGQPWYVRLQYRQSPLPLVSSFARVNWNEPAIDFPGMINVLTDSTGRLVVFQAVPPSTYSSVGETGATDWSKFFIEAGLDINKFEKAAPKFTPPVAFTEQLSWTGTMAEWTDIPITIEAASFQGKPVYFEIWGPWAKPLAAENFTGISGAEIFLLSLAIILLVGIVLLVWRNIKNGRADLRGTAKLMLFFMVFGLLGSLVMSDHVFAMEEFGVLGYLLMTNLFFAVFFGLCYCAVEPFVRRLWSEYLISWSRLLAGDFRDPMVGRDILIGGLAGCVYNLIVSLSRFVAEAGFGASRIIDTRQWQEAFDGLPKAMALLLDRSVTVTSIGLAFLGIFLIIYFVVRNKKAALILICLLQLVTNTRIDSNHWIIYVGIFAGVVLVTAIFNRYGLVAFISLVFFLNVSSAMPMTFNSSSILFTQTVVTLVILVGLMAYAAYISIGGAKMFGGKSLLGD